MKSAGIIGVGKCVPAKVVTNHDLVKMGLDTSDEWIVERTGIRERRVSGSDVSSSDLGYEAAKAALADAGVSADQIDLIIVATTTPDHQLFPSTACLLQQRLGLRNIGAFDLSAACSGFNFALTTAAQYVQTGYAKRVLLVAVDCLSKWVDWNDRSICVLFGDGAGAVVVGEVENGLGLLASAMYADGSQKDILNVPKESKHIYMNGKAVFKVAVNNVLPAIQETLAKANVTPDQLAFFVSHQANMRIIDAIRIKLGLRWDQMLTNIERYGNTSAASIPLVLAEANEKKIFKKGDTLAMAGFGAGFTWGVNVLKWAKN